MRKIQAFIGAILIGVSLQVFAIPTLFFDGTISYDSSSNEIFVDSELAATDGIAPSPNLINSSLIFSAVLDSVSSIILPSPHPGVTVGLFSGIAGDDLTVIDGDSNTLLTGEFLDLELRGVNTLDFGSISGTFNATSGSLASDFSTGNLFALQLNLTTDFSTDMFRSNFSGDIEGRLEGTPVPEPGILSLLSFGLLMLGLVKTLTRQR
jgi:hypothetical protein